MNRSLKIIATVNQTDGTIVVTVPKPDKGIYLAEEREVPDGQGGTKQISVISFKNMTREQRAHHEFWANGTLERIQGMERDSKKGAAGVKKNLAWLLGLRVQEAYVVSGIRYEVEVKAI